MEWQPIESAPKDTEKDLSGPKILLLFGDGAVSVAYWEPYYAKGGDGYAHGNGEGFAWVEPISGDPLDLHYSALPSHWMPLPKPPIT